MAAPQLTTFEQGKQLAQALKDGKVPESKQAQAREALVALRSRLQEPQGDPRIATKPVPTGDPVIDLAGQSFQRGGGNLGFEFEQTFPSLDGLPADDPLRVKKQRVDEGYDLSGANIPFMDRRDLAAQPNIVRARQEAIQQFLGPRIESLPPDLRQDALRYDEVLGDYVMLLPDKEDPSKFRWTSLEGAGLELADVADVMNPAEVLSMLGGVVGSLPKGRVIKMGGPKLKSAINGLVGGLSGRAVGELVSMAEAHMRTGFTPTYQELEDLGMDSLQIEAFATATGEFGAAILRTGTTVAQELAAKAAGKQAVFGDADELALHNQNIIQTRADMRVVEEILGKPGKLPVTQASASRSIDLIEEQGHKTANASRATQRTYNKAVAQDKRTTEDVVNTAFGGNERFLGDLEGSVKRANRHVLDANTIVAQTDNGQILFRTNLAGAEKLGLNVNPDAAASHWGISGAKLRGDLAEGEGDLSRVGFGKKMYGLALHEANAHGKGLQSGPTVREEAAGVWDSLRKSGVSVERNPNATFKEGIGWTADDAGWVFRTKQPEPISRSLLPKLKATSFEPTARGTVRAVEARDLSTFMRGASGPTRRTVEEEISENTLVRQQWKEALLEDYERTVLKGGKVNGKEFAKWKKETSRFREILFEDPEDYFESGQFGKVREVVETSRFKEQAKLDTLEKVWKTDGKINFKDPSQADLWNQFKRMEPGRRRMAMRVLDNVGLGATFRAQAREELKNTLISKSKATNFSGIDTWLTKNKQIIKDVYGENEGALMVRNINTIRNILQRRSDRAAVKGLPDDANPTGLALTRVIFGPLSRAQRFFSAARRGQTRAGAADLGDIITDPDLLKGLVQIRAFRAETVAAQRWMQDAGVLSQFWWDGEEYDINNAAHRRKVADNVKTLYLEELANAEDLE